MFGKPTFEWHFKALINIHQHFLDSLDIRKCYSELGLILERFTKQVVAKEPIVFSNLFSRLSFINQKYSVTVDIQNFRRVLEKMKDYSDLELFSFFVAYWSDVNLFISQVYQIPVLAANQGFMCNHTQRLSSCGFTNAKKIPLLKVTFLYWYQNAMICHSESSSDQIPIRVFLPFAQNKDIFTSVRNLWSSAELHLLDVIIDSEKRYYPSAVVIQPDYLLDVSSIAECFQDYGFSELHFLANKIKGAPNSMHILIGNFANLVMDEVINNKSEQHPIEFNEIFQKHFEQFPLEHLLCKDIQSHEGFQIYQSNCKAHFNNIRHVVTRDFSIYGLNHWASTQLEPSFLSNIFGLQGRLDLLHYNSKLKRKLVVVELKSGSGPFPDTQSNIKSNHKNQLFMYYLMLAQIVGLPLDSLLNGQGIGGFIFYSKMPKNNLRSSYLDLASLQEICEMRNRIIINEHILQSGDIQKISNLFKSLSIQNLVSKNLNRKFLDILDKQFKDLTYPIFTSEKLYQLYFFGFYSFIAREQILNKCGDGLGSGANSLSGLWNRNFEQKKQAFSILYDLEIVENNLHTVTKRILFKVGSQSDFSSFRVSEACILYPFYNNNKKPTNYPIVKCTITYVSLQYIEVECRYMQSNLSYFSKHKKWALERDFMDSSFSAMYKGMYQFLLAANSQKALLLTQRKPRPVINYNFNKPYLSIEQNRILNNMLGTQDYFVLNGPPGTGKTSHIIKEFIAEVFTNTQQSMLILSYTNKAVDELSQAVLQAIDFRDSQQGEPFVRLGNKLSCDKDFQGFLLDTIIEKRKGILAQQNKRFTRSDLRKILLEQRIFLSTVSSMSSRNEFIDFKKFDWVIVDEASQILEPQIIGLLARSKKFILIGDHKQLPAIVLQDSQKSKTNHPDLHQIGLKSYRNSLFERLYNFLKLNDVSYAFDTLTYQGRMHQEICDFPNQAFYNGVLKPAALLENLADLNRSNLQRQISDMFYKTWPEDILSISMATKRVLFFNCKAPYQNSIKTIPQEAELILQILLTLQNLHKINNLDFKLAKQVGIIAPFKNQIALIHRTLLKANLPDVDKITIDTVERFQGGQRDFIIYAFSVNDVFQMDSIVNLNDEQSVDRKLNVALTRAKEQLILIGNAEILSHDILHGKLLSYLKQKQSFYNV
ncbi:AAA domain-containing protein [Myroides sp. LJL110]